MPLFRYACPSGHEVELLRHRSVDAVPCACGAEAQRCAVNHVAVIGRATVPRDHRNYRQSYGEYREAVAEVADGYKQVNDSRGPREQVQSPDYYGLAKAQATAKGFPVR